MKRLRIPVEFLVLGTVIIALMIYLLLRNPDRIQYQIPELEPLTENQIQKIELDFSGKTITLEQADSRWLIQPQGYTADADKVKKIMSEITQLHLTDVISESGNYIKYGLDPDKKITVRIYDKKNLLRTFEIGKQAATYRHTFVKIKNDRRVFHAENSFRNDFERTVGGLRDKSVLQFEPGEIQELQLAKGIQKIQLTKTIEKVEVTPEQAEGSKKPPTEMSASAKTPAGDQQAWVTNEGIKAVKQEIESLLNDLSDLKCQDFVEGKSREDFSEPMFRVTLKGAKEYTLSIFDKIQEKDDTYPAVSSESPYLFILTGYTAEQFMKKIEDVIPTGTEK